MLTSTILRMLFILTARIKTCSCVVLPISLKIWISLSRNKHFQDYHHHICKSIMAVIKLNSSFLTDDVIKFPHHWLLLWDEVVKNYQQLKVIQKRLSVFIAIIVALLISHGSWLLSIPVNMDTRLRGLIIYFFLTKCTRMMLRHECCCLGRDHTYLVRTFTLSPRIWSSRIVNAITTDRTFLF